MNSQLTGEKNDILYPLRQVSYLFAWVFAGFLLFSGPVLFSGPARADDVRLMVYGDSLVAGLGLPLEQGFPAQLQQALLSANSTATVISAGVSGDTTAGGAARLDWALAENPDYVIIVLGGNDLLRGIDPAETRKNLTQIVSQIVARDIGVLLCGMYAPANLGEDYGMAFNPIYPQLAEQFDIALYPFFLEGVALNPALNQNDGIHPNKEGVAEIVKQILPFVSRLIEKG